tara:strand:+ start:464 stop:931 length:468 start_codon:yes stop_codon:yes gene_type:complete
MTEVAYYQAAHNRYAVDTEGNVYLLDGIRIKKASRDRDGYLFYTFHVKKYSHFSVRAARVVWEAWNGPIPEGLTVDHINGIRDDNRLENLRLLTPEDNVREGRSKEFSYVSPDGEVFVGKNIKKFCTEHNLNHMYMCYLNSGKIKQFKGWKRYEP